MNFAWAKTYMPRSLYGRAALILLVPVVTLQLVVSVVFIQRHFEGVTEQMTRNIALELRFLRDAINSADSVAAAGQALATIAGPLNYVTELPVEPPGESSLWFYDFSGKQMIETLRDEMEGVIAADLARSSREVTLWLASDKGVLEATFDRRRVSASNPHQLLVLMIFTGILLTVIAFVFLRNQLRPINRLAEAATEFGRGRIVPYRPSGANEVRAAGNAFLDMRARIERQMEQRTMMLSGVSHDMRTPLTRMKLELSMLEPGDEVAALKRDVDDMERLLDEFLAFAREESLDDPVECDPVALVKEVIGRFGDGAGLAQVTGEGRAKLRPMAVGRALENLIGNALRYGSRCEVRVAVSERAVRISVEDDGPGIPEDRREEALKPFARLDEARNQDKGTGVGLGLAIARDIARRHGGTLVLGESDGMGGLKADLVLAR
ncbi:ATP-binding protein [Pseudoruegeria sp. HB172150]|uniref:ATP-binding protein n=1 Tax=Pseudoruegeria sp. HB172150 TaxID=2721164 RepID=UPI001554D18F|nr:ATP-binding protein [Pseudoruegeria sp. HB172150]